MQKHEPQPLPPPCENDLKLDLNVIVSVKTTELQKENMEET